MLFWNFLTREIINLEFEVKDRLHIQWRAVDLISGGKGELIHLDSKQNLEMIP